MENMHADVGVKKGESFVTKIHFFQQINSLNSKIRGVLALVVVV